MSPGNPHQTFTCGLNTTTCSNPLSTFTLPANTTLLLRPSQLANFTHSSHPSKTYPSTTLAALTLSLTLPLLLALLLTLHLLHKSRARAPKPKLMYKLPDNHSDLPHANPSNYSLQTGYTISRRASVGSTTKPAHFHSFAERYGKREAVAELDLGVVRCELDGVEAGRGEEWVELPGKRTSEPNDWVAGSRGRF